MSQESTSPVSTTHAAPDLGVELTSGFAHRFIRHKVRQLVRQKWCSLADQEDLEQELRLWLLRRAEQFDQALSDWPAFVTTVIERRIASLVEHATRHKRQSDSPLCSLSDSVTDATGHACERHETLSDSQRGHAAGVDKLPPLALFELRHDVATVLDSLPPDLRQVCDMLRDHPVQSVARRLGLPRGSLACMLKEIRDRFEAAGISQKF